MGERTLLSATGSGSSRSQRYGVDSAATRIIEGFNEIPVDLAEPWGPLARRVEAVLAYSSPYGVAVAMERVLARAREEAERSEREAVAAEVERLLRESGLSRAQFASRIGTSASRLSTYATGRVTPSAAMLVRMRRLGGRR